MDGRHLSCFGFIFLKSKSCGSIMWGSAKTSRFLYQPLPISSHLSFILQLTLPSCLRRLGCTLWMSHIEVWGPMPSVLRYVETWPGSPASVSTSVPGEGSVSWAPDVQRMEGCCLTAPPVITIQVCSPGYSGTSLSWYSLIDWLIVVVLFCFGFGFSLLLFQETEIEVLLWHWWHCSLCGNARKDFLLAITPKTGERQHLPTELLFSLR